MKNQDNITQDDRPADEPGEVSDVAFSVGADPELFIYHNGNPVTAHNFDLGTKKNPMETKHGAIQVDGLAMEVNVRPAYTVDEFMANLRGVLDDLYANVAIKNNRYILTAKPTVYFTKDFLASLPPEAAALGCEPEWSAYTGAIRPMKAGSGEKLFRTGGGHIHVGWTEDADVTESTHIFDCLTVAKELDFYLGLPSLLWDPDTRRRDLYGRAGSFRPKPYGMEYRVMSNAWVRSPGLSRFVAQNTFLAIENLHKGDEGLPLLQNEFPQLARGLINNHNTDWVFNHKTIVDRVFPAGVEAARRVINASYY